MSVPRLHDNLDALLGDEDEEERLFGAVSEDSDCYNDKDTISECGGEEYYDEDSGTLNVTLKNNFALEVLIDKEIKMCLQRSLIIIQEEMFLILH